MARIPVAFICDRNYILPTVVSITSLILNKNKNTNYDIYIVTIGLSEEETEIFYKFKKGDTDIHVIKASLEKFIGLNKSGYVTPATYLKFDLPELIPHLDKILYLDSDVIIQKDLNDLFETNIQDCYAGAVKDIVAIDHDLNIENYFNAGVILFNLTLMRENDASASLLNIRKSPRKLKFMDQDCFNILFNKKVKLLPVIYNCFYQLFLQEKDKYTIEYINKCFGTDYSSLNNLKENSYIIHLVSNDKPWLYFDTVMAREWDKYFKKSPFQSLKLKRESIKLYKFIIKHDVAIPVYYFFVHWNNNGFKFALHKVKKRLFSILSSNH